MLPFSADWTGRGVKRTCYSEHKAPLQPHAYLKSVAHQSTSVTQRGKFNFAKRCYDLLFLLPVRELTYIFLLPIIIT
jgi:hypothetical protein